MTINKRKSSPSKVYIIDFSKLSTNPLNPISVTIRQYIVKELQYAIHDPDITSIIVTGGMNEHNNFSSGADITEFSNLEFLIKYNEDHPSDNHDKSTQMDSNITLNDVINMIELSPKPVIAAINGICLGGGCEMILGCHYRVCSHTIQIGLPEVHVGVIPGGGGTQRLPRLIGIAPATSMIVSGKPITSANKALQMKLVDAIVGPKQTLHELAHQWALYAEVIDPTLSSRRLCNRVITEKPEVVHGILHAASLAIPKRELGGDGMHYAIQAIKAAARSPSFEEGMNVEKEYFIQTLLSEQGQARRYSFFATRNVQKVKYPTSLSAVKDNILLKYKPNFRNDSNNIPEIGIIGAGTMGIGIAIVFLLAGYKVNVVDINDKVLQNGIKVIHEILQSSYVGKKRMSNEKYHYIITHLLKNTTSLHDLKHCSLIVEAAIENMKIKQNIFEQLDTIVIDPNCIFVSNTSTLDINVMSSTIRRKSLFAGLHFFSPAHVMKLIEIVQGNVTSHETITILQLLCKRISKIAVVVGNCDGFVGNRMLQPYTSEMVLLLTESVATIQSIDHAIQNIHGFPVGPFAMSDIAGNDIGYNIRLARGWVRQPDHSNSDTLAKRRPARYTELADDMVAQLQRLGQKVGKGWYDYFPTLQKGRKGLPSQEMEVFIKKYQTKSDHYDVVPYKPTEIIERLLYPLVNEGFKILEENIASSPEDIDVIWIYGYGWPAYKGGPMYWANHIIGLQTLLSKLQEFHHSFPQTPHYQPSSLLLYCVENNITVDEFYRQKKKMNHTNNQNPPSHSKL